MVRVTGRTTYSIMILLEKLYSQPLLPLMFIGFVIVLLMSSVIFVANNCDCDLLDFIFLLIIKTVATTATYTTTDINTAMTSKSTDTNSNADNGPALLFLSWLLVLFILKLSFLSIF